MLKQQRLRLKNVSPTSQNKLSLQRTNNKKLQKVITTPSSSSSSSSSSYSNFQSNAENSFQNKNSSNGLNTIENQHQKMEKLFYKFNLTNLEDYLLLSSFPKFNKICGNNLKQPLQNKNTENNNNLNNLNNDNEINNSNINYINNNNNNNNNEIERMKVNSKEELLSSLYPHYPWPFIINNLNKNINIISDKELNININNNINNNVNNINNKRKKYRNNSDFKSLEKQRELMDYLFIKFKLKTLDDWLSIAKIKIIKNGGNYLIEIFKKDIKKLLKKIYPNFSWDFSLYKFKKINFQSIEEQRKRMDEIFLKLNLKSHDDWANISRNEIAKNGGKKLLFHHYKGNLLKLLKTIYPNYFFSPFIIHSFLSKKKSFKSIENQKIFMDILFTNFRLHFIDDWIKISRKKFTINGGRNLLNYYKNNFPFLLQSIYPNYPFDFQLKFKFPRHIHSIEKQKEFMDELFIKLNLNTINDWIFIPKERVIENGGFYLLSKYKKDMKKLLSNIYPNFPWQFEILRNNLSPTIKEWIKKYSINQKKDWHRIEVEYKTKNFTFDLLKQFFPSEKWKKSNFQTKGKKTTQRLLFSFTQMIYPSLLIFENYFHPKLFSNENSIMELDIFIPALQLALEYQGEQHYDDLPAGFSSVEALQSRDVEKEKLAKDLNIKIIYIPYWWDQSLTSLLSSIQSQFK